MARTKVASKAQASPATSSAHSSDSEGSKKQRVKASDRRAATLTKILDLLKHDNPKKQQDGIAQLESFIAKEAKTAPARPASAYNMFVSHKLSELKDSKPELKAKERMALASTMWKDLTEDEKSSWKAKAGSVSPATSSEAKPASKKKSAKKAKEPEPEPTSEPEESETEATSDAEEELPLPPVKASKKAPKKTTNKKVAESDEDDE